MAHLLRPLIQLPRWQHQCCSRAVLYHLFNSTSLLFNTTTQHRPFFIRVPSPHRTLHYRPRGLRLADAPVPSEFADSDSDSDSNVKKSRNEKKREARRAVRWAEELAAFSVPQIKRILRVVSLETEVFDALMLAKRLGRDVREGKRRHFNYIGRLVREVQPELMDGLIQATKDGDQSKFKALSGSESCVIGDDEEPEESEYEDEEEGSHNYLAIATRWFDGLINKDINITNEIYSVHSVEFDRQELRRLVRLVYSLQDRQTTLEENEGAVDASLPRAEKSLARFLRGLAKQLPTE